MTPSRFWSLVAASRQGCVPAPASLKAQRDRQNLNHWQMLKVMPHAEVFDYRRTMARLVVGAFTWELWASAAILRDGCAGGGGGGAGGEGDAAEDFPAFAAWL